MSSGGVISTPTADLSDSSMCAGDGLVQRGDSLVVTKAGLLKFRPPNRFWVDTPQRRVRRRLRGSAGVRMGGIRRGVEGRAGARG